MTRDDPDALAAELARLVCLDVAEHPDRTSPDDWPEAMLVTSEELYLIVSDRILAALKATRAPDAMREALELHIASIEQWASLMRRGQLTEPRAAGRSIGGSASKMRAALAQPTENNACPHGSTGPCSICGDQG